AHRGPAGVVEVLLAAGLVPAGGLQVPVGVGADPHLAPRRRDHQALDTLPLGRADRLAARAVVAEALAATAPRVARLVVPDVAQARAQRGLFTRYSGRERRSSFLVNARHRVKVIAGRARVPHARRRGSKSTE